MKNACSILALAAAALAFVAPAWAQDPPTNVTATAKGPTTVDVAWSGAAGALKYRVQRGPGPNGPWTTVSSALTTLAFTDGGAEPATSYAYRVVALHAGSQKFPSQPPVIVNTPASAPPPAPPQESSNSLADNIVPVGGGRGGGGGISPSQAVAQGAITPAPARTVIPSGLAAQAIAPITSLPDLSSLFYIPTSGSYAGKLLLLIANQGSADVTKTFTFMIKGERQPALQTGNPVLDEATEEKLAQCQPPLSNLNSPQSMAIDIAAGHSQPVILSASGPFTTGGSHHSSISGATMHCVWKVTGIADVNGAVFEANEANNQDVEYVKQTVSLL